MLIFQILLVFPTGPLGLFIHLAVDLVDELKAGGLHGLAELLALGADRRFVRDIFVRVGLLISGIGGLVGLVVGMCVVLVQQHFGLVKMPSGNFLIENYPVALQLGDMIIVLLSFVAVAWAVSLVATRTMIKNDMICEK